MNFKVLETRQFNDKLIVLYDWMEFPNSQLTRNLCAYDLDGEKLWTAEGQRARDFFTGFVSDSTVLRLTTWERFSHLIDLQTGRVLSSEFTK